MEEKAMDQAPIWDDINTFSGIEWRGIVDCITAGFPCQPFTLAGRRKGTKDERFIWPEIVRIAKETEAPFIFLENVPGIVSMGLESVLGDLASMGFDAKWACIPASAVGAPHIRERWFCIAYSDRKRFKELSWLSENQERRRHRAALRRPSWPAEPNVCRVDDGIPYTVDRIKCLGNAVVPAQAELAWRILT
jgi:DNA (cytosine-5)-methyltransferase 1